MSDSRGYLTPLQNAIVEYLKRAGNWRTRRQILSAINRGRDSPLRPDKRSFPSLVRRGFVQERNGWHYRYLPEPEKPKKPERKRPLTLTSRVERALAQLAQTEALRIRRRRPSNEETNWRVLDMQGDGYMTISVRRAQKKTRR